MPQGALFINNTEFIRTKIYFYLEWNRAKLPQNPHLQLPNNNKNLYDHDEFDF